MQFSKHIPNLTLANTFKFPLSYKYWATVIGVGFCIGNVARQICEVSLTGFTTSWHLKDAETNSWLALGI